MQYLPQTDLTCYIILLPWGYQGYPRGYCIHEYPRGYRSDRKGIFLVHQRETSCTAQICTDINIMPTSTFSSFRTFTAWKQLAILKHPHLTILYLSYQPFPNTIICHILCCTVNYGSKLHLCPTITNLFVVHLLPKSFSPFQTSIASYELYSIPEFTVAPPYAFVLRASIKSQLIVLPFEVYSTMLKATNCATLFPSLSYTIAPPPNSVKQLPILSYCHTICIDCHIPRTRHKL